MIKKFKRKSGFTLLETIISMAVITILSVGVYNAYLMLIRSTRDGQVKQGAALAGKKIVEQIKSSSNNVSIKEEKIYLSDNISIDKNSKIGNVKIKSDGSITDGDDYEYEAHIDVSEKTTDSDSDGGGGSHIDISSYSNSGVDSFIIGNNIIYRKNDYNSNDNEQYIINKSVKININLSGNGTIGFDDQDSKSISTMNIVIDLKYCSSDKAIEIDVNNETSQTLKLCILNSQYLDDNSAGNKRNVNVNNLKGIVNEYYRTDSEFKSGTLYDISVEVYGKDSRGERKSLFQSNFVQNMNVD